jgi:hypothetical protein
MNGSFSLTDLYGGVSPIAAPPTSGGANQLEPIYSDKKVASWFIGLLILYAGYYTLTEFVL